MADMYFPVLSHFQNGNPWSSNLGRLRFLVRPDLPQEGEATLNVQIWEGPWAPEFSVMEETKVFPLTQEGLEELPRWLIQRAEEFNARPERTLAENIARRVEPASGQ